MQSVFPTTRYRRLRSSKFLRDLMQETQLSLNDLIYPIFVEEDIDSPVPVSSMPGVNRHPEQDLDRVMKEIHGMGIKAVMMFGVSHYKDDTGSDSLRESGLMARMIERAKNASPETLVMADACFCEYTSHGHCGVVTAEGVVDNDQTLENLAQQAIIAAQAGADVIAPSGMMDGMVSAIRGGLDQEGFENTPIMAYSTKFASGFYGPFRAAAGCELKGDRKTYQMDPANGREALKESFADEAEGADILMVKPGMPYLDVIARLRDQTLLPIAAYQVSGEYAMIKFAAAAGAVDETQVMMESLLAFKRAGADLVLSYFAPDVARILNS